MFSLHFLTTAQTPAKINRPPSIVKKLNVSLRNVVASSTVTKGSANRKDPVTAAPNRLIA